MASMLHCFQRTHRQHFLVVKWAKKPEILEKSLEACPSALQIPSICFIDHVRHVLRTRGRSGKFLLITLPISSFLFLSLYFVPDGRAYHTVPFTNCELSSLYMMARQREPQHYTRTKRRKQTSKVSIEQFHAT